MLKRNSLLLESLILIVMSMNGYGQNIKAWPVTSGIAGSKDVTKC